MRGHMDAERCGRPNRARRPLEMGVLLAVLLAVAVSQGQRSSRMRRQDPANPANITATPGIAVTSALTMPLATTAAPEKLRCHSCEQENGFGCTRDQECPKEDKYCAIVATKIFPRFYFVTKQCSRQCPFIEEPGPAPSKPKRFVIERPMVFFYIKCCTEKHCNLEGPANMTETSFREDTGRARARLCGHPGLAVLSALTAATFAGLGLL